MKKYTSHKRGFTLMLATLIASLLLILGASMFGITRKEIILSSIGRDSQFAFYAADSGAECALYWDIRHDVFSTTTPFTTARCDAQNLGTIQFTAFGTPMSFEYQPNGYCARVSVTKNVSSPTTVIYSRGYSTTCAGIEVNPRALERAVEILY